MDIEAVMMVSDNLEVMVLETLVIGTMEVEIKLEIMMETGILETMVDLEAEIMVCNILEVEVLVVEVRAHQGVERHGEEVEMQSAQMIMILMMMKKLMLTAVLGMMILFRKMMKYSNVKSMRLNSTLILILNTI